MVQNAGAQIDSASSSHSLAGRGCLTECPEEAGADSQASPVEAMLKISISLILLNVVMLAFIAGPKWHQDCPGKIGMGSFRIILWAWELRKVSPV